MRITPPERKWTIEQLRDWAHDLARRHVTGEVTWDVPSIGATTTTDTTLSDLATYPELKGLRAGKHVTVTPPSDLNAALGVIGAWCAADNQLTIRLRNFSAGAIDQGSGTWSFSQLLF